LFELSRQLKITFPNDVDAVRLLGAAGGGNGVGVGVGVGVGFGKVVALATLEYAELPPAL
jgi:hypothetical protein